MCWQTPESIKCNYDGFDPCDGIDVRCQCNCTTQQITNSQATNNNLLCFPFILILKSCNSSKFAAFESKCVQSQVWHNPCWPWSLWPQYSWQDPYNHPDTTVFQQTTTLFFISYWFIARCCRTYCIEQCQYLVSYWIAIAKEHHQLVGMCYWRTVTKTFRIINSLLCFLCTSKHAQLL